jgi:hypothetical protein
LRFDSKQADDFAYLQERLYKTAQIVSWQTALPPQILAALTTEITDLSQIALNLRNKTRNDTAAYQLEIDKNERDATNRQRLVQNALAERDRACAERDSHQAEYQEAWATRRKLEDQKIQEVEKKHLATIEYLRRQLRFKDEQINGKRSLWLNNHKDSSSRRVVDMVDPFATPIANRTPRTGSVLPPTEKSREKKRPSEIYARFPMVSGPPPDTRMFSDGLPHEYWPYLSTGGNTDPSSLAESGQKSVVYSDDEESVETDYSVSSDEDDEDLDSQELVPFKTEEEIALEFRAEWEATYGLVEKWVSTYTNNVNDIELDQKVSHDETLWPFMLGCTYKNTTDAHEHTILLLRNPATRAFFVMRVIVQYLHRAIWKATAFADANPKLGRKLLYLEKKLKSKGRFFSPHLYYCLNC